MNKLSLAALALILTACGGKKSIHIEGSGQQVIIISTQASESSALAQSARDLGLTVEGESILRIKGDASLINQLEISEQTIYASDVSVVKESLTPFTPDAASLYLAKKDFGLLEFWQNHPNADGRGVTVGVFDDGISAHQSGYLKTTTGERKLLKKGSNSSLTTYQLEESEGKISGMIQEDFGAVKVDLNLDTKHESFQAEIRDDKVCLDLNLDKEFSADECRGSFEQSGEFFLIPNSSSSLAVEFNTDTKKLQIFQPEVSGDSHGEGVASVMASHNQAGIEGMNGVAPGAKIVDFDISETALEAKENEYTMGNILQSLEWLAQNGAEVINISYSLFFNSVKSQEFMSKAIDNLVTKYNVVFTFSAGNNGPGLGSLNRKVIYPDSVLVTGAFVSKELDARVWGVSGLPEEGRVIYYSSRGPGPLGDHGPTLISPLSSLTHSSPDQGFSAFSGTSSASPALGGAATVLISAIKQAGLKVDAKTVVQALRQSGKRLVAEPFVSQGYGLPQIDKALVVYKEMMAGKRFTHLNVTLNTSSVEGIAAKGLVLYASKSSDIETARISLNGVVSKAAPSSTATELLVPLKVEYSNGITGSEELWASVSSSRLHIDINVRDMLKGSNGEVFGEVRLKDARNDEVLAIVPVTVLGDRSTERSTRAALSVGPQGSARLHFNAKPGVKAMRVRAQVLEGDAKNLVISTFDKNKIRMRQLRYKDEFLLEIPTEGHYQVALAMAGGTERNSRVEFEVTPIGIELLDEVTMSAAPQIRLKNDGNVSTSGHIEISKVRETIKRIVSKDTSGEIQPLEATIEIAEATTIRTSVRSVTNAAIRYAYTNCSTKVTHPDGKIEIVGESFTSPDAGKRKLDIRCMPFDQGVNGAHNLRFEMTVAKVDTAKKVETVALLPGEELTYSLSGLGSGKYTVSFKSFFGDERFTVGNFEVID